MATDHEDGELISFTKANSSRNRRRTRQRRTDQEKFSVRRFGLVFPDLGDPRGGWRSQA